MPLVVDASVVLAWHFEDETSDHVEAIRQRCETATLHVPWHWFAEVASGILIGERRKRANEAQGARFITFLNLLDVSIDGEGMRHALTTLLPLARRHRLTVYDAAYLELAARRGLELATLDRDLANAARAAGVAVVAV